MKAITVTVVGLCAVLSVSAQNWPGFRGAAANGVAAEAAPAPRSDGQRRLSILDSMLGS